MSVPRHDRLTPAPTHRGAHTAALGEQVIRVMDRSSGDADLSRRLRLRQAPLSDLAESHDVDIGYACRAGTCGECKVRLLGGRVEMACEEGLTPATRRPATS